MGQSAAAVFEACAQVVATRQRMDGLLLDVLAAPGLGLASAARLRSFLDSGALESGQHHLEVVTAAAQDEGEWT